MKKLFVLLMVVLSTVFLTGCGSEKEIKTISSSKIGDLVYFGKYKNVPLTWIVLEDCHGKKLIISEKVIEDRPFDLINSEYQGKANWANCTLKKWLEKEFYNEAFSEVERRQINTSVRNGIENKLFLPSCEDARKYFKRKSERKANRIVYNSKNSGKDEEYCKSYMLNTENGPQHVWIVRDSGEIYSNDYVTKDGYLLLINADTGRVNGKFYSPDGVRPMMWVSDKQQAEDEVVDHELIINQWALEVIDKAPINSIVKFGRHHGEEISWIVIAQFENKGEKYKELCTEKVIDCTPYNSWLARVTWETSSLRSWLNGEFYNAAFNQHERAKVTSCRKETPNSQFFGTKGGNSTVDKVWCMSYEEVIQYMPKEKNRTCKATDYAVSKGVLLNDDKNSSWWLRTPGPDHTYATFVDEFGIVDNMCLINVDNRKIGVRPVILVNCD